METVREILDKVDNAIVNKKGSILLIKNNGRISYGKSKQDNKQYQGDILGSNVKETLLIKGVMDDILRVTVL